jgi:hypothetical protein
MYGTRKEPGTFTQGGALFSLVCVCFCPVLLRSTYYKAVRVGGRGNNGGHVLRETTSRGLCGLVCPSRNSERGGGILCERRRGERRGA